MRPERWREIEELYHAARERGRAVLAGADPELRAEVEGLLAHDVCGGILDGALTDVLPDSMLTTVAPPSQLGPYRIEAKLGAGGMGEVFRATDTRLHRTVAIKILPNDKIADAESRRRLLHEARAASALNHPNIVTLHDIATENGIDYLVMEHVAGKSLDKLIPPKGVPLEKAIDCAVQIASALAAAHDVGIVHRDIKPANVIVTPESHVKVLDFGLAKLTERALAADRETRLQQSALTESGMVVGTVAYMSPEQARGEELDARTDLFSFGAVLYEMVTGRRAFPKAFDWTAPPMESLPPGLRRIVLRLLKTDREERYQTAAEITADLKRFQRSNESRHKRWRWWAAGAAAAAVLVAALAYARHEHPARRAEWVQLTNFPDSVSQPALSPDGRMLAFVRGPDTFSAPGQIYVKLLPDGEAVELTHDKLDKMSPVFSPDGSRIAYTVTRPGNKWDTWVAPVVNGQPRLWLSNASGLIWLDKQRLLFSEVKNKNIHMGIVTAEETRAGERDVYVPASERGMAHRSYPSPDGKWSLVVEMERGAWLPCRIVPIDGSSAGRSVGPPGARCTFAAWSPDGKWMYFTSSAGGTFHTWRQSYPNGQPQQITSGLTEEEGIAMAPDGRSFITSVALRQSVVWVHDGNGERQISLEGYSYDPKLTPDGKKLCYRILKGALAAFDPSELHFVELDTGHNERLLPGLTISGRPGLAYSISPDGRQLVAAVKDREGKSRLWLTALDGQSPPHQIPNAQGDMPQFGTDGEVFFRALEGPWAKAWLVHEDGTGSGMLSNQPIVGIYGISQDRKWVVIRFSRDTGLMAVPVMGGAPVQAGIGALLQWSPDGRLVFVSIPGGPNASNILGRTYVVPLPAGQMFPKQPPASEAELAELPGVHTMEAYDVAPGPAADVYAFSRQTVQRNLYRIPIP